MDVSAIGRIARLIVAAGVVAMIVFTGTGAAAAQARLLGTNLNEVVDYSPAWVFVDAFKTARPWSASSGTLALTPEGWVASLQSDQVADTLLFQGGVPTPTGTWTLLYEGDGDLAIWFGGSVISSQPGRMLVEVSQRVGGIGIRLTRTNPANPLRNIRFVMPGFESTFQTQPFHPLFLERLRPFKVLRFMDWLHTNNSLIREFSERRKPTDALQVNIGADESSNGRAQVAIEFMIDLCNTLGVDGWFNMPHLASDDYVRQFATLVRDRLRPELKAYVEYTNESWNSIFTQFEYVNEQGMRENLAPGDFFTAGLRYYSRRAVQVFNIWTQVFGGGQRLVRVLAGQGANPYTGETVLDFENAFQHADAYAIAPYFGGELDDSANTSLSVAQALALLTQDLRGPVTERIAANRALAQARGVRFITYEGGQHLTALNPPFDSPQALSLEQLFTDVNRSPGIGTLYQEYLNTWQTQGGGDLFMHFNDVSIYSRFGYWGALEFQDQEPATAFKYQALIDYSGFTSVGRATFVAPAAGSRYSLSAPTPVTFTWTAVPGAGAYLFEFTGPNRQFANPNGTAIDPINGSGGAGGGIVVTGTTLQVELSAAMASGSYQVRALGLGAADEPVGTFSDALNVIVGDAAVPTAARPTFTAPAPGIGAVRGATNLTFTWIPVEDVTTYFLEFTGANLQFANPNGRTVDAVNGSGGAGGGLPITGTSITLLVPAGIPAGTYQVRVLGTGTLGQPLGSFSDALSIEVLFADPSP